MDSEMEYVPLNIKQEPTPLQRSETTVNGSTSNCSNNSSQATPDSVENKVSITDTHIQGK